MNPTGATKDELDPIDVLLDVFRYSHDLDKSVAARLQIKSMINERERLRVAATAVLERFQREYHDLTDGQFGSVEDFAEVKQLRAALNDATTSTSAGGG